MSVHLQCQEYFNDPPPGYQTTQPQDDPLLHEYGWPGVAQGLMRVLTGHLILIGAIVLSIVAMIIAFSSQDPQDIQEAAMGASLTIFFVALFVGLASLISYYYVLSGKWRCALSSPERNNAKWLIFGCMVCVLLGPAVSILSSFFGDGGLDREARMDADGNLVLSLDSSTSIMQIAGGVIGLASMVCFVLFLRAVAVCFNNTTVQSLCTGFLIAVAVLIGFSVQSILLSSEGQIPIALVGLSGLGWLGCGVWYLLLIFMTRACIVQGLEKPRSPFDVREEATV